MKKPSANIESARRFVRLVGQLRKEQENAGAVYGNEGQILPGEAPPLEANAQGAGGAGEIASSVRGLVSIILSSKGSC